LEKWRAERIRPARRREYLPVLAAALLTPTLLTAALLIAARLSAAFLAATLGSALSALPLPISLSSAFFGLLSTLTRLLAASLFLVAIVLSLIVLTLLCHLLASSAVRRPQGHKKQSMCRNVFSEFVGRLQVGKTKMTRGLRVMMEFATQLNGSAPMAVR
jgi:hypothetical protein